MFLGVNNKMKISNRTKDKLAVIGFLGFVFGLMFLIVYLFVAVVNLFATTEINYNENLTEQQQINKYYTEERVKAEMYYLSACETIENMSEEEYINTFYKEDSNA